MKLDIEMKRLKEVDFLNLFEIIFEDWSYEEGKKDFIVVNYYSFDYQDPDREHMVNYKSAIKYFKMVYKNLNKYNEYCIGSFGNKKCHKELQKLLFDRSKKIDKYLLNIKLKNKLPEVRKTKVVKI